MISGEKSYNDLYYCHEQKEKKRCPECGSLETKKHGYIKSRVLTKRGFTDKKLQRYFCKQCHRSFTAKGYDVRTRVADRYKREIVMEYIGTKASLSEVCERHHISKTSLNKWVIQIAEKEKEFYYFGIKNPSGYIQIDGKEVRVKGKRRVILIVSDAITHRLVCYGVYTSENKESARHFFIQVKELYPFEILGVVSDFGRGRCFMRLVKEIFREAKHQVCIAHFLRHMWIAIPRTRRSRHFWRNKVLKAMITAILKAETKKEAIKLLNDLVKRKAFFKAGYQQKWIRSIVKNFDVLTAHYDDPNLDRTSNVIENINRQLERKLKNTDGFKSDTGLNAFLKLWFLNFVKKFDLKTQLS